VLFVLIPTVLAAVALFGLSICRLAALSDHVHAAALAELIAASRLSERTAAPADRPCEQFPLDPQGETFRATG
jgi:hypothetical protein